jgi:hypothetical protein
VNPFQPRPRHKGRRSRCTRSTIDNGPVQRGFEQGSLTSRVDRTPARTPVPGDGGVWVQVDVIDASMPVAVENIVAALWVAAERGELDARDVTGPDAESFAELARPVVLYLLMNDHAGILAARERMAALEPGSQLHRLADQIRAYAAELFLPPLDVDIPDTIPDDFGSGEGW